jgi:hypothetical protein
VRVLDWYRPQPAAGPILTVDKYELARSAQALKARLPGCTDLEEAQRIRRAIDGLERSIRTGRPVDAWTVWGKSA